MLGRAFVQAVRQLLVRVRETSTRRITDCMLAQQGDLQDRDLEARLKLECVKTCFSLCDVVVNCG